MQLIYLTDIFVDSYNIVRDRFEKETMKIRQLVAKKQRNFNIYQLGSVCQKTMKIGTRNNNTQIVRKLYWFVKTLEDLEIYWANAPCNL